jgi:DNA repair exonuclease SbcCD nuclease subunit
MFKVLHFSDSHLGYLQYQMVQRLVDFAAVLDQIADIAIAQQVNLVVDTGDTFHSPEPDPFSVGCYRKFAEKLKNAGIRIIAIDGNHNQSVIGRKAGGSSWLEALSGVVERPISTSGAHPICVHLGDLTGPNGISLIACDWMPSDKIGAFLEEFRTVHKDSPVDMMLLHQSCEGFIPQIGTTELQRTQLDGVARYVGIGDLHVNKLELRADTIIASTGSTELVSLAEDPQKYVHVVTFNGRDKRVGVERLPLKTRPVLKFGVLASEAQADDVRAQIMQHSAEGGGPLVFLPYNREAQQWVQKLRAQLVDAGYRLFRAEPESAVDYTASFAAAAASSTTDMAEILREVLKDPALEQVAVDLWANPDNIDAILDQLQDRYRAEEFAAAPAPAPAT